MILSRLFLAVWCAISASIATAHEFWIEPERYQMSPGDNIRARLKNGEVFEGVSLAYFPRRIARFDIVTTDGTTKVSARLGDNPALDTSIDTDTLAVILHETQPSFVTYKTWEKFQKFADHKDFADWRARHDALGFPDPPFKERYTRHAKALVTVGNGAGSDAPQGMKTEFVALTNPYDPGFDGTMRVEVLYQQAPRADVQVEVFDRAPDNTVTVTLYRTNDAGRVSIPVAPGHEYLFDAVVLEPIADESEAVWDTFWAALTFAVPAR